MKFSVSAGSGVSAFDNAAADAAAGDIVNSGDDTGAAKPTAAELCCRVGSGVGCIEGLKLGDG